MAVTNYYELLEIMPTAPPDDIKRAFRAQIAKYHPDKVQHLGKEFQAMAATRAADLTEAYRILSDETRRAEYDRSLGARSRTPEAASAAPTAAAPPKAPPRSPSTDQPVPSTGAQFMHERATRDEYVRNATMERLRVALAAVAGAYDAAVARGFDIALVPKSSFFSRSKNPRLLGRFVPAVDREAVAAAWAQAARWAAADDACVLLMGTTLAAAGELAAEIGDQRRKQGRSGNGKLVLIPIDARDWEAHIPRDAPEIAKTLLARLKSGT